MYPYILYYAILRCYTMLYYVSIPVVLHILIPAIIVPKMQMRMPITTIPPATPPTMIQGDTTVGGSALEGERKRYQSTLPTYMFCFR